MTDTEKAEYERVVRELATKLEETVGEVDRLQAVVAKLTGTDGAHDVLRRMYLDEAQNPNTRVRAAQAALGVEKASLKPQSAPLELTAERVIPLADLVRRRRARADALLGLDPNDPANAAKFLAWANRDHTDEPPSFDGDGNSGTDNGGNTAG
jgi:hypothetical protein